MATYAEFKVGQNITVGVRSSSKVRHATILSLDGDRILVEYDKADPISKMIPRGSLMEYQYPLIAIVANAQ